jgi:hypothetical protein
MMDSQGHHVNGLSIRATLLEIEATKATRRQKHLQQNHQREVILPVWICLVRLKVCATEVAVNVCISARLRITETV